MIKWMTKTTELKRKQNQVTLTDLNNMVIIHLDGLDDMNDFKKEFPYSNNWKRMLLKYANRYKLKATDFSYRDTQT